MRRLLLIYPPLSPPTAPPLGIAQLKAAVQWRAPAWDVTLHDANLALLRGTLDGGRHHWCESCGRHGVACLPPGALLSGGRGEQLLSALTSIPRTSQQREAYITAAQEFDQLFVCLRTCLEETLVPYVEGRAALEQPDARAIFGDTLDLAGELQPELVGISVLGETSLTSALALAALLKEQLGVPVALGGALTSHLEPVQLLRAFPFLDMIFVGEAEHSLPRLLEAGLQPEQVDGGGITYRRDGEVAGGPLEQRPEPGDIPFADFSDLPPQNYLSPAPVLPLLASRGCYWNRCRFCSHTRPYGGARIRRRSVEHLASEIEAQQGLHGAYHFLLVDEAIPPAFLVKLSRRISELPGQIIWGAEGIRPEPGFDKALLREAHGSGLRWIYIGVESFDQRLLDLMDKGTRVDDIEHLLGLCTEVGITALASHIHALPSQTEDELEGELPFLRRHMVDTSPFVLFEGTRFAEEPAAHGLQVEGRRLLYRRGDMDVHSPRIEHTGPADALSPTRACQIIEEEAGDRPLPRPHLGEVHAVALAHSGFFDSGDRPPPPAPAPARALAALKAGATGDTPWSTLNLAGCQEAAGDAKGALQTLQASKLQRWKPGDLQRFNLHKAACHYQLQDAEACVAALDQAPTQGKAGAALKVERLRLALALGDVAATMEPARDLVEAGSRDLGVHMALALGLLGKKEHQQAALALQGALEIAPGEPEALRLMAMCHGLMGDAEQETRWYSRFEQRALWLELDLK